MEYILCGFMGYLIGSVNPSYLMAKRKGVDIRTRGSGNAGASNALILFGKVFGLICALLDIFKACASILLARGLFPDFRHAFAVAGTACVIGHIFPFYMKFKGGKGFACLAGMILCFDVPVFLMMLFGAVVLAFLSDYLCFVPVVGSILFPIIYGFLRQDPAGACILFVTSVVMVVKHLENFRRIYEGKEMRLSYLWKEKEEIERMKKSVGDPEATLDTHSSGRKL